MTRGVRPGLDLCLCGDERREHVYSADRRRLGRQARSWRQCKHWGCRCVRFRAAPLAAQQGDLFVDDAVRRGAMRDFGRHLVDVLAEGGR